MQFIKLIGVAGCILLLSACRQTKSNAIVFQYDYEHAYGWEDIPLEKGIAHSGQFCERINPDREYSHGFTLPITGIGRTPIQLMKASVWANATEISGPVYLVLDVFIPGSNQHLKFIQQDLSTQLSKKGGWHYFTAKVDLKDIKERNAIVKAYIWNNQRQHLWIDDFTLVFEPSTDSQQ